MQKIICKKLYDTETAEIVKKTTFGSFGDPSGYEETLCRTPDGAYFIYTNGGETSPYTAEGIKRVSEKAAKAWLEEHN